MNSNQILAMDKGKIIDTKAKSIRIENCKIRRNKELYKDD